MNRVKSMSLKEFMNKDKKQKVSNKELLIYSGAITSSIFVSTMLNSPDIVSASSDSGIDKAASNMYDKLLNIGKWIIIIKGGIDSINSVVQGDFDSAKKSFLGYLVVYLILNALPWSFDQVDSIFSDI